MSLLKPAAASLLDSQLEKKEDVIRTCDSGKAEASDSTFYQSAMPRAAEQTETCRAKKAALLSFMHSPSFFSPTLVMGSQGKYWPCREVIKQLPAFSKYKIT